MKHIIFCISLLAASLLFGQDANGIEQLPNGRITVSKMTTLLDEKIDQSREPICIRNLSWSADGSYLLIDIRKGSHCFQVAKLTLPANETKTSYKILTARRKSDNRSLNNSSPVFIPAMPGYVFVGQTQTSLELNRAYPLLGLGCNLLFSNPESNRFTQLTRYSNEKGNMPGVVKPVFSDDGKYLFWTGVTSTKNNSFIWGSARSLKMAQFSNTDNAPSLSKIEDITPAVLKDGFLETAQCKNGKLLFSGSTKLKGWSGMDIYTLDITQPGATLPEQITKSPGEMDRFPSFSPSGKKIAWAATTGFNISALGMNSSHWQAELRSELWIMDSNGNAKNQLTFFSWKGHEHFRKQRSFIGCVAWHPHKENLIAIVLNTPSAQYEITSSVILLELKRK